MRKYVREQNNSSLKKQTHTAFGGEKEVLKEIKSEV